VNTNATPATTARLPKFVGGPADAAARLQALRIAIVGCGSVGLRVALALARLGVKRIVCVDPKRTKAESILTHPILPSAIGRPKAELAAEMCRAISPTTVVEACVTGIAEMPLSVLAGLDAMLMATDNLRAEVDAGQLALNLGVPLIHAAVLGEMLVAQVRFFGNASADAPCPACLYNRAEWQFYAARSARFNCAGAINAKPRAETQEAPTMSVSFLCSMAADLAMMQLLRHALRLGKPVADTMLEYCAYTHRTTITPLARNPRCQREHVAYERVVPPRALADCAPAELVRAAGLGDAAGAQSLAVDDLRFAETGICQQGHTQALRRFAAMSQAAGVCDTCGQPTWAVAYQSQHRVPLAALAGAAECPLRQLGAESPRWAVLQGGARSFLFLQPVPKEATTE
jgi:molybdopterin/thiamine biosynthesis adenylyltransferase